MEGTKLTHSVPAVRAPGTDRDKDDEQDPPLEKLEV